MDSGLLTFASVGSLKAGDIVTFEGVRWWPWYKRLWYHFRYMQHTNPMFKPVKLRQFVVTAENGNSCEISPLLLVE